MRTSNKCQEIKNFQHQEHCKIEIWVWTGTYSYQYSPVWEGKASLKNHMAGEGIGHGGLGATWVTYKSTCTAFLDLFQTQSFYWVRFWEKAGDSSGGWVSYMADLDWISGSWLWPGLARLLYGGMNQWMWTPFLPNCLTLYLCMT